MSGPEQHHYRCIECQQMAVSERKGRCLCDQCVIDLSQDDGEDMDEDAEVEWEDECGLMHDGQCSMAGTEHCDFSCPNRDSECFAGSKAWMKAHGSACHKCGAEIPDGQEPGCIRPCLNCTTAS